MDLLDLSKRFFNLAPNSKQMESGYSKKFPKTNHNKVKATVLQMLIIYKPLEIRRQV
jgi:hypothetical protein